jgi:hypothetical protein
MRLGEERNRRRDRMQPATVELARDLASRYRRTPSCAIVRPNDALEWKEHPSAFGTQAFGLRRCRLAGRRVGNGSANPTGASQGAGQPEEPVPRRSRTASSRDADFAKATFGCDG